jgi:hypothetical protein
MKTFNEWLITFDDIKVVNENSLQELNYMLLSQVEKLLAKYPQDQDVNYLKRIATKMAPLVGPVR